ncbi:MAG: hypothetical protein F2853_00330 [Actinobacteria bacterium]|uniref:Unannotated protein n=1 Tax=freshwater metagenome TaxID=449393 RepID=A0A6J7JNI6_9ZZZZ|nr:hypothetical protein [Actinomycetota bacterium]MSZ01834.1 hypothetical protein [Actinomycetota bacterium]
MKIAIDRIRVLAFALVLLGVLFGIFDAVRTGALLLSVGTIVIATTKYLRSNRHRKIELILPVGMAALLFVVALTLPHAK